MSSSIPSRSKSYLQRLLVAFVISSGLVTSMTMQSVDADPALSVAAGALVSIALATLASRLTRSNGSPATIA